MGFRRVLALAALAVGTSAFEVDLDYLATVTDDLHKHLSSALRSLVQEHARPQPALIALNTNATCGPCVQEGSKFIIEHTVGKMKEMCSRDAAKSCIAGKVCGMMAKHPKVMLGMMVEHVRPMSLAHAYCTGKGHCDMPNDVTMSEISMGSEPHEALLDNFDKIDWSDVEEQTEELVQVPEYKEELPEEIMQMCKEQKHHMPVCPKCMKKAMRHVMGHAVMKVKAMCAHADKMNCKVMQKMCPWMAEHKEVAMGMLAAKVEPWKFAFGFCRHKKMSHKGVLQHAMGWLKGHFGHKFHHGQADVAFVV